jgi:beta-N-acetylhexosaminidase
MPDAGLADRVGGLFILGFEGTKADELPADLIAQSAGVILFRRNLKNAVQLRALTDAIRAIPRADGLASLIAIDQEGGQVSRLAGFGTTTPSAMALGAARDPSLTESMYRLIGDELAALGINLNFAPVSDVNNNPDNPVVGTRSFGDDPAAVSLHVRAAVRGLRAAGIAATAKHFPGHGDTTVDSHLDLPNIPHGLGRMRMVELVPFVGAIAERVDVIMTAHVLFPAVEQTPVPATLSRSILTGLLRDELGFDGVVCTDCMEMSAIVAHYTPEEAAAAAVMAGADLVLFSHTVDRTRAAQDAVAAAVRAGTISEERVQSSLDRVRKLRARLLAPQPGRGPDSVGSAEHQNSAFDTALRAITLVRDPKGQLPLSLAPSEKILVVQFTGAAATAVEDGSREDAAGDRVVGDSHVAQTHGRYATAIARALSQGPARIIEQVRSLDPSGHEYKQLLMGSGTANAVVAVTSRAKEHPMQARALADLSMIGKRVIVVAGREPYDADVLPPEMTVIASYGEDGNAMRAAAEVILGTAVARGHLPVKLSAAASPAS